MMTKILKKIMKKPTKKKYPILLNIKNVEKVKYFLKNEKDHKASFGQFMDYQLENFCNNYAEQINPIPTHKKEGGTS